MQYTFKEQIQCVSGTGYIAVMAIDTWNDVKGWKPAVPVGAKRREGWVLSSAWGELAYHVLLRYRQCVSSYRRSHGDVKMAE